MNKKSRHSKRHDNLLVNRAHKRRLLQEKEGGINRAFLRAPLREAYADKAMLEQVVGHPIVEGKIL